MPSSPGYKRDYKQEYHSESRRRRKLRAMRNRARRELMKEGKVHVGDGKDVDHINPLGFGGGNSRKNLRVRDHEANASYQRTKGAKMKYRSQA